MKSNDIRTAFLKFFAEKNHKVVPSAPIVVKNDPTLMFTNAGMNQFKDFFLGTKNPKDTRVADTQKCLRVSGKHNDLEEVGYDTYHHTMFEMLGNWSFGDYFKKDAIEWAWELLTGVFKIPEDRLYATVFEGDAEDHLDVDHESIDFWKAFLPENRILKFDKKDNFWEMGETGPCGPCSEIHMDMRSEADRKKQNGKELVNKDHPEVIEIWNLVFMQFNRKSDRSLVELPQKHVDTGMGFERLSMALQNKKSSYDTDVFTHLIDHVSGLCGKKYGDEPKTDIAFRVIVDHIRAIAFSVADGQLPSNVKAGYVIRRILRRAVRYGYTFLELETPFLHTLIPLLADQFQQAFPELKSQQELVSKVILEEEQSFLRTLGSGIKRLQIIEEQLKSEKKKVIPGQLAFELYDTYGFPADLTRLIAQEKGLTLDEKGFETEMKKQKERSKKDAATEQSDWTVLQEDDKQEFIGYDQLEAEVKITRYREVVVKGKKNYHLVFNYTPFYAESGGQVGDKGYIKNGGEKVFILDTRKENDQTIHIAEKLPEDVHASFRAVVNDNRRQNTMSNHSATHLLHAALRGLLGEHVQQKGSLVAPDYLRFDFSHFSKMEEEEVHNVEQLVNQKIRENIQLEEHRNVPFKEALKSGAMALFGEKYGDVVRTITFDKDFSVELCGGTHVKATGAIGLFKITTETSVASGIRRIEAVTGPKALEYVDDHLEDLKKIKIVLKSSGKLVEGVQQLVNENQELKKELESMQMKQVKQIKADLLKSVNALKNVNYLAKMVELESSDAIKNLAFGLNKEVDSLFLVLGAKIGGKANLTIMINKELAESKELNAGQLIRELAKEIKGGGGGQAHFATAGGSDPSGLEIVFNKTKALAESI